MQHFTFSFRYLNSPISLRPLCASAKGSLYITGLMEVPPLSEKAISSYSVIQSILLGILSPCEKAVLQAHAARAGRSPSTRGCSAMPPSLSAAAEQGVVLPRGVHPYTNIATGTAGIPGGKYLGHKRIKAVRLGEIAFWCAETEHLQPCPSCTLPTRMPSTTSMPRTHRIASHSSRDLKPFFPLNARATWL